MKYIVLQLSNPRFCSTIEVGECWGMPEPFGGWKIFARHLFISAN